MILQAKLAGILAILATVLTATYTGVSINDGELSNQAAALNSLKDSISLSQPKEVPVEDAYFFVKHLNSEIERNISLDNQAKLKSQLLLREDFLIKLAKSNPDLFLRSAISPDTKSRIPEALKSDVETNAIYTGSLEAIYIDDFTNEENSGINYYLQTESERLPLYLASKAELISGSRVQVNGVRIGDILVADSANVQEIVSAPAIESVGEQKILTLLLNFTDSGTPPISPDQVRTQLFNGIVQKFYQDQSYGKTYFSGDVSGWHTVPRTCGAGVWPGLSEWSEVANVITQNSINLGLYDRLVLVVHANPGANCLNDGGFASLGKTIVNVGGQQYDVSLAWVGVSDNSAAQQWSGGIAGNHPFSWTKFNFVVAHELGHNLGVMHANGWNCGENIASGHCEHIEYGNVFDAMGRGFSGLHFNAFYKEQLGWLSPQEGIVINQTGRYTIAGLEGDDLDPQAKKYAKIQMRGSTATPFYLEWRRGVGFNGILGNNAVSSNKDGLFVNHIVTPGASSLFQSPFSRLLDMQPSYENWDSDIYKSTLERKARFTDVERGISIGALSFNSNKTKATFDVRIADPVCVRGAPLIGEVSVTSPVAVGSGGNITTWYGNGDSVTCNESAFNIEHNISAAWQPTITPSADVSIAPNDFRLIENQKRVEFTIPPNTPAGTYPLTYSVINKTRGERVEKTVNVEVVNPPSISSIIPNVGTVGSQSTISGSNFTTHMTVVIYGTQGYFVYPDIVSVEGRISFTVPNQIIRFGCQVVATCFIPTPTGGYSVSVASNNIYSTPSPYQISIPVSSPPPASGVSATRDEI